MEPRVLWRDEHLLFVLKPPGMPSQGDPVGDPSVTDWVSDLVSQRLDPIHRLDRPVGGLMVFGLRPESVRQLNLQFAQRTVRKLYLGATRKAPEAEAGRLEHDLVKDARTNRSQVRSGPRAKRAELSYRVLERLDPLTLLELEPHTGRHHQIRVQLAAIGSLLVGDVRYGAKRALQDRSIGLFAYSLAVRHPRTGQEVVVGHLPEGYPWERFATLGQLLARNARMASDTASGSSM